MRYAKIPDDGPGGLDRSAGDSDLDSEDEREKKLLQLQEQLRQMQEQVRGPLRLNIQHEGSRCGSAVKW
jgi:hypothetical protein